MINEDVGLSFSSKKLQAKFFRAVGLVDSAFGGAKALGEALFRTPNKSDSIQPLPAFSGHGMSLLTLIIDPRPQLESPFTMSLRHVTVTIACFELF
jgi:hypothetical protein